MIQTMSGVFNMENNYGVEPKSVGFGEAIGTCFKKYFVFEGRASKSEFWYFFLFYTVGYLLIDQVARSSQTPALLIAATIMAYGTIIPVISVGCRRLHDTNKSGWWQLIPIANLILWAGDSTGGSASSESRNYTEVPRSRSIKNDLTDELEELQELYEDGTLSEEQFKKAKNKLLK